MKSIDDIIRDECLPRADCMLTVQDINGEAGFLYFKDAELIEANYATLWGKDAMAEVLVWSLADYAIAPLPLGIKRSLWDSIETLLNPKLSPTASGRIPVLKARYSAPAQSETTPFDNLKDLPGVTKVILVQSGKLQTLFQAPDAKEEQTEWIADFLQKATSVGETLGFGFLGKLTLSTDRFQMVGVKYESGIVGIIRKSEVDMDDFEAVCQESFQRI